MNIHSIQKSLHTVIVLLFALTQLAPVRPAAAQSVPLQAAAATLDPQPVMLKDIYTADASSLPSDFFNFGEIFLFNGSTPETGRELWVSDGTAGGTQMVIDINPGPESSYPSNFTIFRGKVFFTVSGSPSGSGLWSTDGTPDGTSEVVSGTSDFEFGSVTAFVPQGDWLYFICRWRLLRYGGPENKGEWVLPETFEAGNDDITWMNGAFYFSGNDGETGKELWRYDVTTEELALVKDICPDVCEPGGHPQGGSDPSDMTVIGNRLYFTAWDTEHGSEVWVSDGSTTGTRLLKDIYPGKTGSAAAEMTAAGGWLYFTANDGSHGLELWRSDGTAGNTTMVADLAPGAVSASPKYLTVMDPGGTPRVYFAARDGSENAGHGVELYSVPVTQAGAAATPLLLEIFPGAASSLPENLTVLGSTLYFSAQDTPGNIELWRSGGSQATTAWVADLVPGPDGSAPMNISTWNGKLVFSAVDAVNGREPWISDGTPGGTRLIVNMTDAVDVEGSAPTAGLLTNVGGKNIRYFTARDALHGVELWRTDGTSAGTWLVKDVYPGPSDGMPFIPEMAEMDGILYFQGIDPEFGYNLWRTDGTAQGTWRVKDLVPGEMDGYPERLRVVGDDLFFTAYDPKYGQELWVSDGTAAGTHMLKDITPGVDDTYFMTLDVVDQGLIFGCFASYEDPGFQLWRSDGTPGGTKQFYDTSEANASLFDSMRWTFSHGNLLYFNMFVYDSNGYESGYQLWVTDGTAAGTKAVQSTGEDIPYLSSSPAQVGSHLYFPATGSDYVPTLWKVALGSNTASQTLDYFEYAPQYMVSLDGENLVLLSDHPYDNMEMVVRIDLSDGEDFDLCVDQCGPSIYDEAAVWRGKLYFSAYDWIDFDDSITLWATDGFEAGTTEVVNSTTGMNFTSPDNFLSTPAAFYFSAADEQYGREPWVMRTAMDHNLYLPAIQRN